MATASEAVPTRNISRRSVSSPISNSRRTTPSSASTWISSPRAPSAGTMPSTLPPSSTPATQLAEDGGLSDPLGELAQQLGGHEHGRRVRGRDRATSTRAASSAMLEGFLGVRAEDERVFEAGGGRALRCIRW